MRTTPRPTRPAAPPHLVDDDGAKTQCEVAFAPQMLGADGFARARHPDQGEGSGLFCAVFHATSGGFNWVKPPAIIASAQAAL